MTHTLTQEMRMQRKGFPRSLGTLWAAAVLAAGACGSPSDPGSPTKQSPKLEALPRALSTAEQSVLSAGNAFSLAWWRQLNAASRDSNVFVSPLSASFALGMTLNGAAGQTFSEMRSALQFGETSLHDINQGFRSLIDLLTDLDPAVTVQIANSIWYDKGFVFHQTFFDTTARYFGATVRELDFDNSPVSLAAINGWASTNTNGKIPSILDEIDRDAVMYLINAIYFNAPWRDKFDAALTTNDVFHRASGGTDPMRLMHRTGTMRYAESASWQAVDLLYGNSAFSMTVLLPAEGTTVEAVASSLSAEAWSALISSFVDLKVELSLPKLTLSYERTLNDDLRALGMHIPFVGGAADFSMMSPAGNDLFISKVKQKAFVDIHEEGTEAAAVTSVGIVPTSAPVIPVMRVDRPYIFVLRERLSGSILFMGKIVRIPVA